MTACVGVDRDAGPAGVQRRGDCLEALRGAGVLAANLTPAKSGAANTETALASRRWRLRQTAQSHSISILAG